MVEVLQHGSRALSIQTKAFWPSLPRVYKVTLDEYNEGDLCDLDYPRGLLKPSSQRHEPFSYLKLVKSATCLRAELTSYTADTSRAGTGTV